MAHFVLEYSSNIDDDALALPALFEKLHASAISTGLFPLKGLRCRAYACDHFRIADGNPDHMFVHMTVLLGAGRSIEQRQSAAKSFFEVLTTHFESSFRQRGVALSFEMKELEPVLKFNKNNIQDYLGE